MPDLLRGVPAVTALLQRVFGVKRCACGLQPVTQGGCGGQQASQAGAAGDRQLGLQHGQQGVAVHLGTVRVVEPAQTHGQRLEFGGATALPFPVDVGKRTGPGLGRKRRQTCFDKRPVERGVVGNHKVHTIEQLHDAGDVQPLALHHHIADAGDGLHLGRNRLARVFQPVVHLHRAHGLAGGAVHVHPQQRQFHDLVGGVAQAGGFGVKDEYTGDACGCVACSRCVKKQARHQPAQHAVVGVGFELLGQGLQGRSRHVVWAGICRRSAHCSDNGSFDQYRRW